MAELLAKKKETKLLPSITDGRLDYLEINKDKMRFRDAKNWGKAVGGNGGMTLGSWVHIGGAYLQKGLSLALDVKGHCVARL